MRQGSSMGGEDVRAADELEALRQLKARYCRFLDTKDVESWRNVFATDVVVTLDLAVSTGGADPMTAPGPRGPKGLDDFVPMVMASLQNAATMHHCHTPELTLTSATTATGIWALEDLARLRRRPRITRRRSLPRDVREAGWQLADQQPASDPNHPEDER